MVTQDKLITQGGSLAITQGDSAELPFTALGPDNLPVDLTGGVFTTYIRGPTGIVVSFDNSKHTPAPDQDANRGQFTVNLLTTDTAQLAIGGERQVITKVVMGDNPSTNTISYHGVGILDVLAPVPVQ